MAAGKARDFKKLVESLPPEEQAAIETEVKELKEAVAAALVFQFQGYAYDRTYPKWFREAGTLFSPNASVLQYSTHCDIYVPGSDEVLRAEVGDYISRGAKGEIKVIKKADYHQNA